MESDDGSKAVQGFVLWIAARGAFIAYVLWALLPGEWLRAAGVTYYPSQYWALGAPALLCAAAAGYFSLMFLSSLSGTHDLDDPRQLADPCPPAPPPAARRDAAAGSGAKSCIPPLADLPVGAVNRALYQPPQAGPAGR
eukprot:TRINITY_DN43171_c0_g1_i1.p2 TRINITY_DN43171_c0_g1~~TRINITY_DN43171_c0_g1_i1.p2  ORF type:complete len:158 (+),score=48.01 TRINITY_DN43171_c0_g1_i1:60-476(+)